MMRKTSLFIFALFAVFVACNSSESDENAVEKDVFEVEKSSELAVYMQTAFVNYESIKDSLKNKGIVNNELFYNIRAIHQATPTDTTIKGPVFDGLAANFLSTVDSFLLASDNKEMYFNISVDACLSCHMEMCPGPTEKIKGLYIKPWKTNN